MTVQSTVQEIIADVYDAALDDSRWPAVLSRLTDFLHGGYSMLQFRSRHSFAPFLFTGARVDPEAVEVYQKHFYQHDYWAHRCVLLPEGSTGRGDDLTTIEAQRKSEFFNDFLLKYNAVRLLYSLPILDADYFANVSIYRGYACEEFDDESLRRMRTFAPHLQRSLTISIRLNKLKAEKEVGCDLLDSLNVGVMFVDSHAKIVCINKYAECVLRENDGLNYSDSGLSAGSRSQTAALRKLIGDATLTASGAGSDPGGTLSLYRPSGRRHLSLFVSPVGSRRSEWGIVLPAAVIFVTDPERGLEIPQETLTRMYDLTPSEAKLAGAIASGVSLKQFADAAEITMNTARWTLKQVLSKTNTSRQAELVRLLHASVPNLVNHHFG